MKINYSFVLSDLPLVLDSSNITYTTDGELIYNINVDKVDGYDVDNSKTDDVLLTADKILTVIKQSIPKQTKSQKIINSIFGLKDVSKAKGRHLYAVLNGKKVVLQHLKVNPYKPGKKYRPGELITNKAHNQLYLVSKKFKATDMLTDIINGNLIPINQSNTNLYKSISVINDSNNQKSVNITLTKPNPKLNRHVFVIKKENVDLMDIEPFTFTESDEYLDHNNERLVFDGSLHLKVVDKFKFKKPKDKPYFVSEVIDINKYKDITQVYIKFPLLGDGKDLTKPNEANKRASASSSYNGNPPAKAFDDDPVSGLGCNNKLPALLMLEFDKPTVVNAYTLYRNSKQPGELGLDSYSPKDWKFQASNDKQTLVNLDVRNNELVKTNAPKKLFIFDNTKPYKYYRIYISTNHGGAELVNISEMELIYRVNKILFLDVHTHKVYKYIENQGLVFVDNLDNITADTFVNQGNEANVKITKKELLKVSDKFKILFYTENKNITSPILQVRVVSFDSIAVQIHPVLLYNAQKLKQVSIETTGKGVIKLLISKNGTKLYKLNGLKLEVVKTGYINSDNTNDIQFVLKEGMSVDTVNNLTENELKIFYSNNDGIPTKLLFIFAFSDNDSEHPATVKSVKLTIEPKVFLKDVSDKCDIMQSYSSINVVIKQKGEYKVLYID